jgi:hypothetical protein
MGDPGLTPEAALQFNQALLYWTAWMLLGFACLAGLTVLVFVWRECFGSSPRQPVLPRSMNSPAPHPLPETVGPRFALLPLIRIALTTRRRAAPVTAEDNDERE